MATKEQQNLVSTLYSVHTKLRQKKLEASDDEEWQRAWREHTSDKETLQEYSKAMHQLATKIWEPRTKAETSSSNVVNKCRLEWVVKRCEEYFDMSNRDENETKLRLLDVGSCYNPFSKYQDVFDITALDLCPAPGFEDTVFKCDFTELSVNDNVEGIPPELSSCKDVPLSQLPQNYFNVIVFSYFLEYLADTKQRQLCCEKAYQLLASNGLLFILRPDSCKVTPGGNNVLMKKLKVGMVVIGFKRVYFKKLKHLWCMAFRKLSEEDRIAELQNSRYKKDAKKVDAEFVFQESMDDVLHELFGIAQDGKEVAEENDKNEYQEDQENSSDSKEEVNWRRRSDDKSLGDWDEFYDQGNCNGLNDRKKECNDWKRENELQSQEGSWGDGKVFSNIRGCDLDFLNELPDFDFNE